MTSVVEKECDLVLIGKTGTGKSSLGNSLFYQTLPGKKVFESRNSPFAVTKQCLRKRATLADDTLLTIVDTPGLFDLSTPNNETIREIVKCIALCSPGPHVILFVTCLRRISKEEVDTVNILKQLFGAEAMKHVIIVFTGKDELDDDDDDDADAIKTVDDFVEKCPEYLQDFIKECNSRYVGIANKPKSPTHDSDVKDVMKLIYKTMEGNDNKVYSKEAFSTANKVIQEEIKKRKQRSTQHEKEIHQDIMNEIESNNDGTLSKISRALQSIMSHMFRSSGRKTDTSDLYDL